MRILPEPRAWKEGRCYQPPFTPGQIITTNVQGVAAEHLREGFTGDIHTEPGGACLFLRAGQSCDTGIPALPEILHQQPEGYHLCICGDQLTLTAADPRGFCYGLRTLRQLQAQGITHEVEITDWPDRDIRGFHLECRFGMPAMSRVLEILDMMMDYKLNTLLLELEDKFPGTAAPETVAPNALTREELNSLIREAHRRFIRVMPLQQTLGHVEYILKHPRYAPLREVRVQKTIPAADISANPVGELSFNEIDEFCPSHPESYPLIRNLCTDMAESFPEDPYLHIGCDEAWNMLYCDTCQSAYGEAGRPQFFQSHINHMAAVVCGLGKIPVIWDDMLREMDDATLAGVDTRVVVMCWLYYDGDLDKGRSLIRRYQRHGFTVLGASSAKCCEGMRTDHLELADMGARLRNIRDWRLLAEEFSLPGVITTVWSNYTGTLAPPHPFFETAWYPVIFAAAQYWNGRGEEADFEARFAEVFFGAEGYTPCLHREPSDIREVFAGNARCRRNHAVWNAYRWISLLAVYRQKSIMVFRELFHLYPEPEGVVADIVRRKISELTAMREYLRPEIEGLLSQHFSAEETALFVQSRFLADEKLTQKLEEEGRLCKR